jgi:hypothetical protein
VSEPTRARVGDWVEVECTLLEPADRSANLPPETAEKPLLMWVKGFARDEAALGEELTIETMTGRTMTGSLAAVNPGYFITYGEPVAELVHVGRDLRRRLATYRAGQAARDGGPGDGGPGDGEPGHGGPGDRARAGGGER